MERDRSGEVENNSAKGIQSHLKFLKIKVALSPLRRIFSNFAKRCILSCGLQFNNKKWGSPSSFSSYKRLKLKLRVFLAGQIVAMVTYCATKINSTRKTSASL